MSFGSQPSAPDPASSSNNQLTFNKLAGAAQNQGNMFSQSNPYGSLNWNADPNAPGGYNANVSLSPQQQQLFNQQQNTKSNFGSAASDLSSNFGSLYGSAPNIDPSALTNKVMGWGQQYMQPIFNQQQSNLDARLQSQGITPGSEAYNNAQNLQSRNVNNAYSNLLMQAEPAAFSQAVTQYQLPAQMAGMLSGQGAPQTPNQSMVQTPQSQVGAPNYQQAAQQQYQAQQAQNAAYNQGIWGMIGNATGLATAPMTGGSSLFGMGSSAGLGGSSNPGWFPSNSWYNN